MKNFSILAFSLLIAAAGVADLGDELDSIQGKMPGCGLGVINEQGLIFEQYAGYANLTYDVSIDEQTVFNIGSIAKHFTAAVFFQLEKQGLFKRSDTLSKFYPGGPAWFEDIQLDHLINHRSGLPDYLDGFDYTYTFMEKLGEDLRHVSNLWVGLPVSHDDIVDIVLADLSKRNKPDFEPGAIYRYSNTGYVLLADIINNHSEHKLDFWANKLIFKPNEMYDTEVANESGVVRPWSATGYEKLPNSDQDYRALTELMASYGDGRVLTTIQDFSKWMRVLNNSTTPNSDWYGFLANPNEEDVPAGSLAWYQNGLAIEQSNGLIYKHNGFSMDSMASVFWTSPEHKVGYVRFCNYSHSFEYSIEDVFEYEPSDSIDDVLN
jgi:CubicO group peptidase (beta-lactamase class C family)